MRVIFILLGVIVAAGWAGWAVRRRDRIAAGLLFAVAASAAAGLVASLLGWPQSA